MTDKVIITNKSALGALYKEKTQLIIDTVEKLIKSDKERGITSTLVFIDDKEQMAAFKAAPVTNASDENQNKDAVDAIFKAGEPEFMLLLGGPDIIPHQQLVSPMADQLKKLYHTDYFKLEDFPCDILKVPSDMPYACESPYQTEIAGYLKEYVDEGLDSKGRYVGRLAGITGEADPSALISAIETAAGIVPQEKEKYYDYFSINTVEPKTDYAEEILTDLFKNDQKLQQSPPASSNEWTELQLSAPTHLFVCHGTPNIPYWYGEKKTKEDKFTIALEPKNIGKHLTPGTVVASLCCYGGQLYDPKEVLTDRYKNFLEKIGMQINPEPQISLCNAYMQNKVAAFCGSTYFSSDPTILEYFLENILQGKTVGEAIFDARHQYVQSNPEHMDLDFLQTTLAEFILLGDPSVQPVLHEEDKIEGIEKHKERKARQIDMLAKTKEAIKNTDQVKHNVKLQPSKKAEEHINQLTENLELENVHIKSYQPEDGKGKITHVITGIKKEHKEQLIPRISTHIVTEENEKVTKEKSLFGH